jgi:hypothetical protein
MMELFPGEYQALVGMMKLLKWLAVFLIILIVFTVVAELMKATGNDALKFAGQFLLDVLSLKYSIFAQ